jgi:amino acid adenylation domain-containing protein
LKAGGAYLPIDPGYPEERIDFMLKDSGAKILLTGRELSDFSSPQAFKISPQGTSSLAYIIYTSGSAGKPKGVMIQHRSLVNRLNWMQDKFSIEPGDTLLQKTPFTFDVSVWEIFWWSLVGARLSVLVPGGEKDPALIVETIEKTKVTVLHFVPSMLNAFLEYVKSNHAGGRLRGLRHVIASGEALTLTQVKLFNELLYETNGIKLTNLYGPTEATIDVSFFDCSTGESLERVPIGKPIDNIRLYVVNTQLHLQPTGIAGELCIAGDGLGRGYLNRPGLTAEKFDQDLWDYQDYHDEKRLKLKELRRTGKKNEINQKLLQGVQGDGFLEKSPPGRRRQNIYRTGDLARWLPDGNIDFLGRMDHQVKIRGFRVELGEIEARLLKLQEIKETVVLSRKPADADVSSLFAYFVSDSDFSVTRLRGYLSQHLPDYMIPSHFVKVETIPLTANGKIDRKALEALGKRLLPGTAYAPPGSETERKIVDAWKEVLRLDKVGIHDNYFDLGGTSFEIIRVNTKLKEVFQVDIPLVNMFRFTTVYSLAKYLEEGKGEIRGREEKFKKGKESQMQRRQKRKGQRRQQEEVNQ